MTDGDGASPGLLLGPMLRYVSENEATIWVETGRACQVADFEEYCALYREAWADPAVRRAPRG